MVQECVVVVLLRADLHASSKQWLTFTPSSEFRRVDFPHSVEPPFKLNKCSYAKIFRKIFCEITDDENSFRNSDKRFRTSVIRINIVIGTSHCFFLAVIQCMNVSTDLYRLSRGNLATLSGMFWSNHCLKTFRSISTVSGTEPATELQVSSEGSGDGTGTVGGTRTIELRLGGSGVDKKIVTVPGIE